MMELAYRYKAPAEWTRDEALKLATRAVEAERQGYDGARLRIEAGMVVIPKRLSVSEKGAQTRGRILAALKGGKLTAPEIGRRSGLTASQVNYQIPRMALMGLIRGGPEGWMLDDGGDRLIKVAGVGISDEG